MALWTHPAQDTWLGSLTALCPDPSIDHCSMQEPGLEIL